ncbi:hypothetical protein T492DRAFT_854094, partial [Pavlovales sp. CCMP2436]
MYVLETFAAAEDRPVHDTFTVDDLVFRNLGGLDEAVRAAGLRHLLTANAALTTLSLFRCRIGDADAVGLGEGIVAITALTTLNLCKCPPPAAVAQRIRLRTPSRRALTVRLTARVQHQRPRVAGRQEAEGKASAAPRSHGPFEEEEEDEEEMVQEGDEELVNEEEEVVVLEEKAVERALFPRRGGNHRRQDKTQLTEHLLAGGGAAGLQPAMRLRSWGSPNIFLLTSRRAHITIGSRARLSRAMTHVEGVVRKACAALAGYMTFVGAAFAMGGVPSGDVDMPNLLSFIPPAPQLRPPLLEAINESYGKVFLLVQKAGPHSIKDDITLARKVLALMPILNTGGRPAVPSPWAPSSLELDAGLLSRYRKASTGLHPDKFNSIPNITIYDEFKAGMLYKLGAAAKATIKGQPANDPAWPEARNLPTRAPSLLKRMA